MEEKKELNRLLFDVLWKPLDLPEDVGNAFKLDSPQTEIIAINNKQLIGGLVANRLSNDLMEIRHLAVKSEYRKMSVGKQLVSSFIDSLTHNRKIVIQVYARNTSIAFFEKLGFTQTGECLEHPEFTKHGITFHKMQREIH
jgi:N-acetylglutamate synthase-like GNAT family acetyltransferase